MQIQQCVCLIDNYHHWTERKWYQLDRKDVKITQFSWHYNSTFQYQKIRSDKLWRERFIRTMVNIVQIHRVNFEKNKNHPKTQKRINIKYFPKLSEPKLSIFDVVGYVVRWFICWWLYLQIIVKNTDQERGRYFSILSKVTNTALMFIIYCLFNRTSQERNLKSFKTL